jgi:nitrite reductase/ring-hydroxylating ferredoxin subunit/uncharacterized membrane protein
MKPFTSVSALENVTSLDPVVDTVRRTVNTVLGPGVLRDLLHGVWLGHPLHPSLVQGTVGAFMSAGVLDALPGRARHEQATRTLMATGFLAAVPSVASGLADWSQMHDQQQRVGLVHAGANATALALYGGSMLQRLRGRPAPARAMSFAGLGMLALGGFIGSHLAFRQAAGANHAEEIPRLVPTGWNDLCALDDLEADGVPQRKLLAGTSEPVPLLVVRQGERIDVLSDRCSHLSGPLHDGEVTGNGSCITCPWHGSTFSLEDGSVRRGPATAPVHAFDVRVESGRVMVRLPGG